MNDILRHPLAIVATFSLFIVAGAAAWFSLPVELFPSLKYPKLVIITSFGNASSEEVESILTRPVEEAVGTVTGLRSMTSVSAEGVSSVELRFNWGANMSNAAAEVREKLDLISDEFPREVKLPVVVQYDPTDTPIITLALTGSKDLSALYVLAKYSLKPDLETVNGVATVRISGGLTPEIQILVDRGRLAAHSVDLKLVADHVEAANINFPGGSLFKGPLELPVRTVGRFKSLDDIGSVSLGRGKEGGVIQVKDLAEVVSSHADRTNLCRVNGKPAVLLGIIKEASANTVEVSRRVLARMDELLPRLSAGTVLHVIEDETPFIERALKDLRNDILWGSVLAFGVLLFFLRDMGSAALIMLAIPVSVISAFGFMWAYGMTVNMMSIGGMALGAGMLLDCSIVVLEAINRKSEQIRDRLVAVSAAVNEVGTSVLSGTITTLAVLVPILFMTGMAQRLFKDFAFAMSVSLLFSLLVSVLLLPAIMVWGNTSEASHKVTRRRASTMEAGYRHLLAFSLNHSAMILTAWAILVLASAITIYGAGFELLPPLETGRFGMNVTLPPESSLDSVGKAVAQIEDELSNLHQIDSYVAIAGAQQNKEDRGASEDPGRPNEAHILIKLKSNYSDSSAVDNVVRALRAQTQHLENVKIDFVMNEGPLARILGSKGSPEILRISGDDLGILGEAADRVTETLEKQDWVKDLYGDGNVRTENLRVMVDRYKAAGEGVTVDDVSKAVRVAIEGNTVGKFITENQEKDIRVRLASKQGTTLEDLKNLPVRAAQDRVVLLGRIADVTKGKGPREIIRSDKRRNIVLHANFHQIAAAKGFEKAMDFAKTVELPLGYDVTPGAARFDLMESLGSLSLAIALAGMLVYAILVVQFESLVWPLVVFTAVPVSCIGPAIALLFTGMPVNVLVVIGGIVLIGIVVNMAILMVATINNLRRSGMDLRSGIIHGSAIRLRPILMTTATTVFGALPICVAAGAANQLNQPLGLTVVTGLLASAAFKLIGLPIVYSIVAKSRWGAVGA